MHFAVTTLTQTNEYNGADQRIKKTETAGTSPADVVEYFYQDREVLYTYCANNPVKYSDPSGHFIWFAIGAAMAVCDGVSAYHKAKKQGKKGWKLVGAVAKKVAVGAVFGKVVKTYRAGKVAAKVVKKVFKSKTVKKLEKKLVKKVYKRPIHKKTIGKTGKVKRKSPNPDGKKGGPAHRGKIDDIHKRFKDKGYNVGREKFIRTAGGHKNTRYGDLVVERNGKETIIQVGKRTKSGRPVARERRAMEDIRKADYSVHFIGYK